MLRALLRSRPARAGVHFGLELPVSLLAGRLGAAAFPGCYAQLLPAALRRRRVRERTVYVFVFLGEFGYELFNWQGVVRRFARLLPPSSSIVVAGRPGLAPFYEAAAAYLPLGELPAWRESVAAAYFALPPWQPRRYDPPLAEEYRHDRWLRDRVREHLAPRVDAGGRRLEFVFSSVLTPFPGCTFGVDRAFYGRPGRVGRIYGGAGHEGFLANNEYREVDPGDGARPGIEARLGFPLGEPYVLVQARSRAIGPQAGAGIPWEPLVAALARRTRVVFLAFETGRALDSGSRAGAAIPGASVFAAASFAEQGCLIRHARRCLFVTEGDLGSHTYLPPFLGRDVDVLASREVFALESAPVAFWNERVFRFGGRMAPLPAEEALADESGRAAAVEALLRRAG